MSMIALRLGLVIFTCPGPIIFSPSDLSSLLTTCSATDNIIIDIRIRYVSASMRSGESKYKALTN